MAAIGGYKLRDKDTGLFSSGGTRPSWNTRGKSWRRVGHVKQHLTLLDSIHRSALDSQKRIESRIADGKIDIVKYPWYNEYLMPVHHPYEGRRLEITVLYYEVAEDAAIPVVINA